MAEIVDLFSICCFLIFCCLLCFPFAPVLEVEGRQIWIEFADSSDAVTDTVESFRFVGVNATDAFVAAFQFGVLGGSAITMLVVGNSIGTAKALLNSVGCFGGAVDSCLLGFVGIRTRKARVTFE